MRVKTAVLISGSGTNLQALIDAAGNSGFPTEISLVISNRGNAYGLERANAAGIDNEIIDHRHFASREEFDAAIDRLCARPASRSSVWPVSCGYCLPGSWRAGGIGCSTSIHRCSPPFPD